MAISISRVRSHLADHRVRELAALTSLLLGSHRGDSSSSSANKSRNTNLNPGRTAPPSRVSASVNSNDLRTLVHTFTVRVLGSTTHISEVPALNNSRRLRLISSGVLLALRTSTA